MYAFQKFAELRQLIINNFEPGLCSGLRVAVRRPDGIKMNSTFRRNATTQVQCHTYNI